MKRFLLLLPLAFIGCTTVYEHGRPILRISSNATNVSLRTPAGSVFTADRIDNSSIHRAVGDEVAKGLMSGGAAVLTGALK